MESKVYVVTGRQVTFADGHFVCDCETFRATNPPRCEHVQQAATQRRLGSVLASGTRDSHRRWLNSVRGTGT